MPSDCGWTIHTACPEFMVGAGRPQRSALPFDAAVQVCIPGKWAMKVTKM